MKGDVCLFSKKAKIPIYRLYCNYHSYKRYNFYELHLLRDYLNRSGSFNFLQFILGYLYNGIAYGA